MINQKALLIECQLHDKVLYRRLFLNQNLITIGKSPKCNIRLPFSANIMSKLVITDEGKIIAQNGSERQSGDGNLEYDFAGLTVKATLKNLKPITLGNPEELRRTTDREVYEVITIAKGKILETMLVKGETKLGLFHDTMEMSFTKTFDFTHPRGFSYSSFDGKKHVFHKDMENDTRYIIVTRKRAGQIIGREKIKFDKRMAESAFATLLLSFAIGFVASKVDLPTPTKASTMEDLMPEKLVKLSLDRIEAIPPTNIAKGSAQEAGGNIDDGGDVSTEKNIDKTVARTQKMIQNYLANFMSTNPVSENGKLAYSNSNSGKNTISDVGSGIARNISSVNMSNATVGGLGGKLGGIKGVGKTKGNGALAGLGMSIGKASAEVGIEDSRVEGGLSKEIIASIINSNIGQIRHCYERQLTIDPSLYGKIVVEWRIDGTGIVAEAAIKNTSMKNSQVETCIKRKIQGWKFPEPKGGGVVEVTYPFLFKSS